jgi:hypothetical protein
MQPPAEETPVGQMTVIEPLTSAPQEGHRPGTVRVYRVVIIKNGEFVTRAKEEPAARATAC